MYSVLVSHFESCPIFGTNWPHHY